MRKFKYYLGIFLCLSPFFGLGLVCLTSEEMKVFGYALLSAIAIVIVIFIGAKLIVEND